jgi:hypothetical protein
VAPLFARDPEIVAGTAPLCPVWRNAAPPAAIMRQKMSELVAERPVDLRRAVFAEARV